jgi:3-oxoacyl-[acyl-carrier-protein] synthase-3
MQYSKVCIESLGHVLPEDVVKSSELEEDLAGLYQTLRIPPGRIEAMTGIEERRFWDNPTPPSEVASEAGKIALKRAGIARGKIGALMHCSVCRDHLEPSTSIIVHDLLGLDPGCMTFDISNACLGFMSGMITVANMIELGQIEAGLVVAGENGRPVVDNTIKQLVADENPTRRKFKKAFASLTIGSGAVAAVLTHKDSSRSAHRLLGASCKAASQYNDLCRCSPDMGFAEKAEPYMVTDSLHVMENGVQLAQDTWNQLKESLGWENDTPDRIFCHQIGLNHRNLLYKSLGLDVAKDFSTVQKLGNMGSVGLPLTLSMGLEAGVLEKGHKVAMMGIGSGLTSVMLGAEW